MLGLRYQPAKVRRCPHVVPHCIDTRQVPPLYSERVRRAGSAAGFACLPTSGLKGRISMGRLVRHLLFVTLIVVLMSALAWAQATAQLSGTVTDETGAVLPGVTVTATQTDTG